MNDRFADLPPLDATPRVAIYMTAYQHEAYVAEAVESVLAQGWPAERLQFVVVDDGSTDGTAAALAPYRDRATVITQENRGLRGAVDRAMALLDGDVITSISGDDVWPEGRLRALVDTLRANPRAGLVYSDLVVTDRSGAELAPSFMALSGLAPGVGDICGRLMSHNFVSGPGCMQRACLKQHVHPIRGGAPWEDWWWAWALGSVSEVAFLPQATCRYRMHDTNMSLGRAGGDLQEARAAELPFRRWMLRQAEALARGHEAQSGLGYFDAILRAVAAHRDVAPEELLAVSADDRAAAARAHDRARDLLTGDDAGTAMTAAVAGLAADPFDVALRAIVETVAPTVAIVPEPLRTRGFVTLADADEIAARPGLVATYLRAFRGGDDATLVIHGRGWDDERLLGVLGPLLEGADADVLAVADPPSPRAPLVARAHALLGTWCHDARLRRFDLGEDAALRAHAERAGARAATA